MTFREAEQWLGRGQGIRRKSWKDKHYSIALLPDTDFIDSNGKIFNISGWDLFSEDWEVATNID